MSPREGMVLEEVSISQVPNGAIGSSRVVSPCPPHGSALVGEYSIGMGAIGDEDSLVGVCLCVGEM